jgi:hypothetical protein
MSKDYGPVPDDYMYPEAGTMPSRYLGIRTMPKGYGPVPDGCILYPEVVISTDKIEDESEKNPL